MSHAISFLTSTIFSPGLAALCACCLYGHAPAPPGPARDVGSESQAASDSVTISRRRGRRPLHSDSWITASGPGLGHSGLNSDLEAFGPALAETRTDR